MTREEILEMSRKENKGMDERQTQIHTKANHAAGTAILLLGCLIAMINVIADGPDIVEDVIGAMNFCYLAVVCGMRARMMHKKFDWFLCVISAFVCISDTLSFIVGVLG